MRQYSVIFGVLNILLQNGWIVQVHTQVKVITSDLLMDIEIQRTWARGRLWVPFFYTISFVTSCHFKNDSVCVCMSTLDRSVWIFWPSVETNNCQHCVETLDIFLFETVYEVSMCRTITKKSLNGSLQEVCVIL